MYDTGILNLATIDADADVPVPDPETHPLKPHLHGGLRRKMLVYVPKRSNDPTLPLQQESLVVSEACSTDAAAFASLMTLLCQAEFLYCGPTPLHAENAGGGSVWAAFCTSCGCDRRSDRGVVPKPLVAPQEESMDS
ncbi:hypothetical protein MBLNU459_g4166t2 [Dothideomycetes sp. NU459]